MNFKVRGKQKPRTTVQNVGNKGNKSGSVNGTLDILVNVFGGKSALEKKSPICAGRYNSTKANEVSEGI